MRQSRIGIGYRREQAHGLVQDLRDDSDRLNQIAVIRDHGRDVVIALEGIKKKVGSQVYIRPLFFNFYNLDDIRPRLR